MVGVCGGSHVWAQIFCFRPVGHPGLPYIDHSVFYSWFCSKTILPQTERLTKRREFDRSRDFPGLRKIIRCIWYASSSCSGSVLRIFCFFSQETLISLEKSCQTSRKTTIIQSPIGRLAPNFIYINLKGSLFRYKFKLFCSAHQACLYEGLVFSSTLLLIALATFSFCPYPSFSAFWISLAFQMRL